MLWKMNFSQVICYLGPIIFSRKRVPDITISNNQISKFSTQNAPIDEIRWKYNFIKKVDAQCEAEKSRGMKGLLNESWGDSTMAAISD